MQKQLFSCIIEFCGKKDVMHFFDDYNVLEYFAVLNKKNTKYTL